MKLMHLPLSINYEINAFTSRHADRRRSRSAHGRDGGKQDWQSLPGPEALSSDGLWAVTWTELLRWAPT